MTIFKLNTEQFEVYSNNLRKAGRQIDADLIDSLVERITFLELENSRLKEIVESLV